MVSQSDRVYTSLRLSTGKRDGWRQLLSIHETRDQLKFRRTAELLLCLAKLSNHEYTFRSQLRGTSEKTERLSEQLRRVLEDSVMVPMRIRALSPGAVRQICERISSFDSTQSRHLLRKPGTSALNTIHACARTDEGSMLLLVPRKLFGVYTKLTYRVHFV